MINYIKFKKIFLNKKILKLFISMVHYRFMVNTLIFLGFLVIIGSISLWNISYSSENNCKYLEQMQQCTDQQDNYRSIEDFVCINSISEEKRMFQIILDLKFKEVDAKMDAFLTQLETDKSYYF